MADFPNHVAIEQTLEVYQQAGGAVTSYVNIVWDPGGGFVQWTTTRLPDIAGSSYPDPYSSGFGATSGFQVLHTFTS